LATTKIVSAGLASSLPATILSYGSSYQA